MFQFQDIPEELSADEQKRAFRKLPLPGFEPALIHQQPVIVVGRILSSSDVLVKLKSHVGNIVYAHLRFGMQKRYPVPEWRPIGGPYADLDTAINHATIECFQETVWRITPTPHGLT
jgi:hypothetical protein